MNETEPLLRPSSLCSSSSSTVYESTGNVEQHKTPESHERPVAPSDIESHVLLETSALGRNLTWSTAYILTISRVLGSGIFATPGVILAAVGSPGLSLLLWVAGAMIAYCGLSVTLEYGCMLPRSGGEKVYLEFTYRKPKYLATVIMATVTLLLGFTASNCLVFARYTVFALELEDTEYMRKALAVGLMTWVTVIHACFMPMGIRIQNFLGWIKIGLIAFMVLSGVFVVLFHSGHPGTENIPALTAAAQPFDWTWTGLWADSIWSWGAIATSVLKVFYSFAGLNNVNNVLNEVKDPVRTLRSVALTALGTACGMYLLVNVAYFLVIPLDEIKSSGELVAALFFERVFGTTVGRRILPSMVALSATGNVLVVTFALARLNQEIARTGLLPFSRMLSTTAPFGSPLGGLIVHYIPSILVITIPTGDVYSFILEVEGYPGQIIALSIAVGLIWLRYKRPDLHRPYKAWLPGVLMRITVALALIAAPFFPSQAQRQKGVFGSIAYALVGISILLFGVLYWYVFAIAWPKWRGFRLEDRTETIDDGTTVTTIAHVPL